MFRRYLDNKIPFVTATLESLEKNQFKFKEIYDLPKTWISDLKDISPTEILASSVGIVSIYFRWNKAEKEEFTEVATSLLTSSSFYGDPLGVIASIIALAHAYTKARDKQSFRNLKWGTIKGAATMGAFSLTMTFVGTPIFGFLIGLCVAMVVRKYIGYLKFLEYLKWMKNVRPTIRKILTRREFLTLNLFTFKRA
jgi:hypothetical protein